MTSGVYPRPHSTQRQAEVMQLFEAGYIGSEIAARLGITRERVRQIVSAHNRNLAKARHERSVRRKALLQIKRTHTLCEVCEAEFIRTVPTVLCGDCRAKYQYPHSKTTQWSAFKALGRKFPEFLVAFARVSKNGKVQR